MTRQQALAERHRLSQDTEWLKKYAAGDREAAALVEQLAKDIVGDQSNFQRAPSDWGYTRSDDGKLIPPSGDAE